MRPYLVASKGGIDELDGDTGSVHLREVPGWIHTKEGKVRCELSA